MLISLLSWSSDCLPDFQRRKKIFLAYLILIFEQIICLFYVKVTNFLYFGPFSSRSRLLWMRTLDFYAEIFQEFNTASWDHQEWYFATLFIYLLALIGNVLSSESFSIHHRNRVYVRNNGTTEELRLIMCFIRQLWRISMHSLPNIILRSYLSSSNVDHHSFSWIHSIIFSCDNTLHQFLLYVYVIKRTTSAP